MGKLNGIWAETARPQRLEEVILPPRLITTFQKIIECKDMPNLLLTSDSPGTGKTTIAEILRKELATSVLYINGSDENGIAVLRDKVKDFLELPSISGFLQEDAAEFKIVFIDEADNLTSDFQKGLRAVMNDFAETARFVFTGNNLAGFHEAVRSRFVHVAFEFTNEELSEMGANFFDRVTAILKENDIKFDEDAVADIIMKNMPDFRYVWEELQSVYFERGKIDAAGKSRDEEIHRLIDAVKTRNRQEVKKVLAECRTLNVNSIWTPLFSNLSKFKPFPLDVVTWLMADYAFKSRTVPDRMLNFMGFVSELWMRTGDQANV